MQRRLFLQLAAGAAAGAVIPQLFALPASSTGRFLRVAHTFLTPAGLHGTVVSLAGMPLLSPSAIAVLCSAMQQPMLPCTKVMTSGSPLATIEMLWEKPSQWIINGRPYRESEALQLMAGQSCRLRLMNGTAQSHALHLQQQRFQVTQIHQAAVSTPLQNAISLDRYSAVDIEVVVR